MSSFHAEWDRAADREGKTRAYFAQQGIKPDEVAKEIHELEPVLGTPHDVRRFVGNAVQRFNGSLRGVTDQDVFEFHPGDLLQRMQARDSQLKFPLKVAFSGIPPQGVVLLGRTHPVVATLCDAVIAKSLSGDDPRFARCGAVYTDLVGVRTVVLVARLRYLLQATTEQFAEEVVVAAFRRDEDGIDWLEPLEEEGLRLLSQTTVKANMPIEERQRQVDWALGMLSGLWHEKIVDRRVLALKESHARLRKLVRAKPLQVTPHTPPDILGCYVLVPTGGRS